MASRERLREIEAAIEEAREVSARSGPKPQGGRPRGGERAAARRLDLSRQEVQRTRQHVETADLSDWEASTAKGKQIRAAEEEASQGAQAGHPDPRYQKRGDSEAARRTGLKRQEVQRVKEHIAAGERFPVLQGRDWKAIAGSA